MRERRRRAPFGLLMAWKCWHLLLMTLLLVVDAGIWSNGILVFVVSAVMDTTTSSSSSFGVRNKIAVDSKRYHFDGKQPMENPTRTKTTTMSEDSTPLRQKKKLQGKIALITGGNSGIGKATAALFVSEGATVIITGRRQDIGDQAVQDILRQTNHDGKVEFFQVNHSRLNECERLIQHIKEKYDGQLDILFNNAGVVTSGTAENTSEELWSTVMDINVTAVWRMCRLALPLLRANGGVIVNNASDWGIVGGKDAVAYCTSKGAVVQMTKAMGLDHANENIRINAVCPGDTYVERWQTQGFGGNSDNSLSGGLQQANELYGKELPIGRVGEASEIAKAVLFLSSDDSSFMTGTTLVVDGGNTAQ